ncbi:hypothetical protein K3495_g928 [Podosphaera aphanis]|nr:hypothetical protein K3495_g928 [Podosphaera aphanis]
MTARDAKAPDHYDIHVRDEESSMKSGHAPLSPENGYHDFMSYEYRSLC